MQHGYFLVFNKLCTRYIYRIVSIIKVRYY